MNTQLSPRLPGWRAAGWLTVAACALTVTGCANPDFEPRKPLVLDLLHRPAPLTALDQYKVAAAQRECTATSAGALLVQPADQGVQLRVVAGTGNDVVELADPVGREGPTRGGVAPGFGDPHGGVERAQPAIM